MEEIVVAVNPVFEVMEEAVVGAGMIVKAVNPVFEVMELGKKLALEKYDSLLNRVLLLLNISLFPLHSRGKVTKRGHNVRQVAKFAATFYKEAFGRWVFIASILMSL